MDNRWRDGSADKRCIGHCWSVIEHPGKDRRAGGQDTPAGETSQSQSDDVKQHLAPPQLRVPHEGSGPFPSGT